MPLFAEITAEGWERIITTGCTALGGLIVYVMGSVYQNRRIDAAAAAANAAVKAATANGGKIDDVQASIAQQDANAVEIKETLLKSNQTVAASTKALGRKVDKVHALVNGPLTARVRREAEALRRVAGLTGDPADLRAADDAERDLAVHVAKDQEAGDLTAETIALPAGK